MLSQAEIQSKIDKLEAELEAGIKTVSTDGTSTTVDIAAKERRLDQLRRTLASTKRRRPVAARINLGGST